MTWWPRACLYSTRYGKINIILTRKEVITIITVESVLLKQIEELNKALAQAKKEAAENLQYRELHEGKVNRNAKDSVFVNLFSYPEYQMRIYNELFPEDTTITPAEIELFRADRVLTNHPYNDLGLLARKKLIVLAEAESQWSVNIIYRLADYYFQSMASFINRMKINVHRKTKIEILDVEAFVIYPGKKKLKQDFISLRDVFFNGDPTKPDFRARIIHGDYKGGIIAEFMGFCRVFDAQKLVYPNDPQKRIATTIDLCIQKGFLAKYLDEHKTEVEQIMFDMYNREYVAERERMSNLFDEDIAVLREANVSEEKIKDILVRRHGISPTYAQNLLDDDGDDDDVLVL